MAVGKKILVESADEAVKIVDTLNTLCHYPKEILKFPKEHLEYIARGGRNANCAVLLHPGQSCTGYALVKCKRSLIQGMKISALFIALPAVMQSVKRLREDPSAWKEILEKFIRSTLYLTLINGLPVLLMC